MGKPSPTQPLVHSRLGCVGESFPRGSPNSKTNGGRQFFAVTASRKGGISYVRLTTGRVPQKPKKWTSEEEVWSALCGNTL